MNVRTNGDARRKILEEAIGIVYREGVERITMRGLAEKLGYSPATIYLHFSGKNELQREIARHGFERLVDRLSSAFEIEDPDEALRQICLRYIEFGLENPQLYRLMFQELTALRELGMGDSPPGSSLFQSLREVYTRGVDSGAFRECDVTVEAAVGWAMVHGLVQLAAARRLPNPAILVEEFAPLRDALIDDRLRSLAA